MPLRNRAKLATEARGASVTLDPVAAGGNGAESVRRFLARLRAYRNVITLAVIVLLTYSQRHWLIAWIDHPIEQIVVQGETRYLAPQSVERVMTNWYGTSFMMTDLEEVKRAAEAEGLAEIFLAVLDALGDVLSIEILHHHRLFGEDGEARLIDFGEAAFDLDRLGRGAIGGIDGQRAVAQRRHEGRVAFEHREIALAARHGDHIDVARPLEAGGGDEFELQSHVSLTIPPAGAGGS